MLKRKISLALAMGMLMTLGSHAQASETQDYLVQKAADLCGQDGEVTYLQCITEDGSRLAGDPDFFALIKKICGAETQIKKCLKEAFVPTPSENTENSTPDSDISSYPEDKKQELAAVSETLPMIAAVPTSTRSPSPAVSESKKILSISPSKAVLVAKTPLPSLTFFKAEKSKKKNRQLPRAAAYSY